MTTKDVRERIETIREALANLASQDFGYPMGVNEVREKSNESHAPLPFDLESIYSVFDGVSLPDVHIGYFIDSASRTASAAERGEPTVVEGKERIAIHVFGSDGGGGRFALGLCDGAIYYLPSSGAVKDGTFIEDYSTPVRQIAASIMDFLDRLKMDIEAFVRDECDHEFMVG